MPSWHSFHDLVLTLYARKCINRVAYRERDQKEKNVNYLTVNNFVQKGHYLFIFLKIQLSRKIDSIKLICIIY